MTNPSRTSTDRRQAREMAQDAILDVAERLAGIDGASSLSLKRLAEEAGVSTMVIYSRFGDRFGLEEALAKRAADSLIEAIQHSGESLVTTVEASGGALWTWAHENRSRFSLLFLTSHLLDATLRPEIDLSILRAARALEVQVGWGPEQSDGRGVTALAAIVGYLTLELREQVPREQAESGYADLLTALADLGPTS